MQEEEQQAGWYMVAGAVVAGQLKQVTSVLRLEERSQISLSHHYRSFVCKTRLIIASCCAEGCWAAQGRRKIVMLVSLEVNHADGKSWQTRPERENWRNCIWKYKPECRQDIFWCIKDFCKKGDHQLLVPTEGKYLDLLAKSIQGVDWGRFSR